jgi:hypothetical protein
LNFDDLLDRRQRCSEGSTNSIIGLRMPTRPSARVLLLAGLFYNTSMITASGAKSNDRYFVCGRDDVEYLRAVPEAVR